MKMKRRKDEKTKRRGRKAEKSCDMCRCLSPSAGSNKWSFSKGVGALWIRSSGRTLWIPIGMAMGTGEYRAGAGHFA